MERKASESITVRIPKELKETYDKYLEAECLTKTEDLRNHIRECARQYKKSMKDRGDQ